MSCTFEYETLQIPNLRRNMEDELVNYLSPEKQRFQHLPRSRKESPVLGNQFKATARWNAILKEFRETIPLRNHRHFIKNIEKSFLANEAVKVMEDILPKHCPEKTVTRTNCVALLQKYLDDGVLIAVKAASKFEDNSALYRLGENAAGMASGEELKQNEARTPKLIKRSISFSERPKIRTTSKSPTRGRQTSRPNLVNNQPVALTNYKRRESTWSEKIAISQRESNGTPICRPADEQTAQGDHVSKADMPKRTMVHRYRPSSFSHKFKDNKDSCESNNGIDVLFTSRQRAASESPNEKTRKREGERARPKTRDHSKAKIIWRDCLVNRLRRLMDVENLPFDLDLSPKNIQWNSIRIDKAGCSMPKLPGAEIFAENIVKKAVYLEEFPFTNSRSGSVITVYERHEIDVFYTLCDRLRQDSHPPIDDSFAHAILRIFEFFINKADRDEKIKRAELDFKAIELKMSQTFMEDGENVDPQRRFNHGNGDIPFVDATPLYRRINAESQYLSPNVNNLPGYMPKTTTSSGKSAPLCRISMNLDSSDNSEENEKTFLSCKTYASRSFGFNEIPKKYLRQMSESISLLLLSMNPDDRRRLHWLITTMNRVSANHCLTLAQDRQNKNVVLEHMSSLVVNTESENELISPSDALNIVRFLIENSKTIFFPPQTFVEEVQLTIQNRSFEASSNTKTPRKEAIYCDRLVYCDSTSSIDEDNTEMELLKMLDFVLSGDLSEEKKYKYLKRFETQYPSIFARKFGDERDVNVILGIAPRRSRSVIRRIFGK
ncbi:unnamed protein product, partial [Mesorhabditis belari]|uniref:DEP domain-containing protein n=1 Tax=Mesorhabditis belari TaxID=2138241 RepID=A0AAF3EDS0_9BILA